MSVDVQVKLINKNHVKAFALEMAKAGRTSLRASAVTPPALRRQPEGIHPHHVRRLPSKGKTITP